MPLGAWANAIGHLDAWAVSDEDGKPYLELYLTSDARQFSLPIFLTGDSPLLIGYPSAFPAL